MRVVPRTSQVSSLLELARHGDTSARARLINYASDRLRTLAHNMLRTNRVRRWEQSDDLLQQTLVRLDRSLNGVEITHAAAFLRLAALEMRHALIDLARRYFGPQGIGANHDTQNGAANGKPLYIFVSSATDRAAHNDRWERLYESIDALPEEEREIVDLLWVHQLTHVEAATLLNVAPKTIARRWARARLRLHELIDDDRLEVSDA